MPTYRVDVKPEMLIWAREFMGLSREQAAKELGKSALDLQYWEEGALEGPTLVQLRDMAELYDVPISAFYLPSPPKVEIERIVDYRQLPSVESREWSVALLREFRRVVKQREIAIELASESGDLPPRLGFSLALTDDPEVAGARLRSWLGVSLDQQLNWPSPYRALNAWITRIESHDILVAHVSDVSLREMRGFSLSEEPFPVIVLNGADSPHGRIFTLLHELVHILINAGGLCDLREPTGHRAKRSVETFCNQVAAATLLPAEMMMDEVRQLGITGQVQWSDSALGKLSRRYGVSREAVLRRLVTLNYASIDYFHKKHRDYLRWYEEEKEEERKKNKDRMGGPSFYRTKLRDLGRRYTAEVIRAYRRQDITAADVSTFLGVKVERVEGLVSLLQPDL